MGVADADQCRGERRSLLFLLRAILSLTPWSIRHVEKQGASNAETNESTPRQLKFQ
jgi:hypothetical protein